MKSRLRNRSAKNTVRTSLKTLEKAIHDKDKTAAEENYKNFVKLLDTASRKGVFHKNMAARKKSRLNKRIKELLAG
jgi:small subunit ribosomal protein S20